MYYEDISRNHDEIAKLLWRKTALPNIEEALGLILTHRLSRDGSIVSTSLALKQITVPFVLADGESVRVPLRDSTTTRFISQRIWHDRMSRLRRFPHVVV